ncbi:MAG: single-stranded DNA-binding protein [Treponema sp.]|jgi:single-strand DNA-binding protein|nr:single-stranded DNA-binding protein [Treponema sp.]
MADINHVVLVGRLTRDAELKYTAGGQGVSKFSLAINRRKKNGDVWEDEPNFFDIVLWGRQAEALSQYLQKGKTVGIEGELRQDRWQQDGQNRSKVEIVANNVQLLGGGQGGGQGAASGGGYSGPYRGGGAQGGGAYGPAPQGPVPQGPAPQGGAPEGAGEDSFADDIPF